MKRASVACLTLGLAACADAHILQGRIDGLREIANRARSQGAISCAPIELALADAQLAFAELELDQGDQARAEDHLTLAASNAHAALHLSPVDGCGPKLNDRDSDGIPDHEDKCPNEAEDLDGLDDADGCPDDEDTDSDQIVDAQDLCIGVPEDVDGYLDLDGCPENDNDADGLVDSADQCALAAEDPDSYEDADGCPDLDNDADSVPDRVDQCPNEPGTDDARGCPKVYKNVVVTAKAVVIREQVHFETNRTVIKADSNELLDTVAQVLRDFPAMQVEVQGHTDDKGPDLRNLKVSQLRADAVRSYLISRGIEPHRLTAKGYGKSNPIESNKTTFGRAANRRVEFVRTDASRPAAVPGAPEAPQEGGAP